MGEAVGDMPYEESPEFGGGGGGQEPEGEEVGC